MALEEPFRYSSWPVGEIEVGSTAAHDFEQAAELAYLAMYESQRPKEAFEDAMVAFRRAIEAAESDGDTGEARRLAERCDHVRAVYDSQFRWL